MKSIINTICAAFKEARIENSKELLDVFNHISDVDTDEVFIGIDRIDIISFNTDEDNHLSSHITYSFNLENNGINSMDLDQTWTLAEYIGKKYFHKEYEITKKTKTFGAHRPIGSSSVTGVTANLSGGGYTVRTSDAGYSTGQEFYEGCYVRNWYADHLRKQKKKEAVEAERKNKKNLF